MNRFWLGLIASAPDLPIAWAVSEITESGWVGFGVTILVLWGVYFLFWLKKTITSVLIFALGGRTLRARVVFDFLRDHRFPEPDEVDEDAELYLAHVADDDSLPVDLRLKAATEIGVLNAFGASGQFELLRQTNLIWGDAIKEYRRSFAFSTARRSSALETR